MRKEGQVLETVISVAKMDERIRAVIINGSKTNEKVVPDAFQDFDIIYLVNDLGSFAEHPNWIDVFGERIILQRPNSMQLDEYDVASEEEEIVYLMLFKDFNRIDLRLVKVANRGNCDDSLNKVLLDKDNLFTEKSTPTDEDYWTRRPSQKEFTDCCNEFWWVSTYVVKGLARNEITYAKDMLEGPVRKMFMKLLAWSTAANHQFSINIGKSNRFLKNYLEPSKMVRILKTYPDYQEVNIQESLQLMMEIFTEESIALADKLTLNYNLEEADNVREYVRKMETNTDQAPS